MRKKNFAPTLYPLNKDIQRQWFIKYTDNNGRTIKVTGNMNKLFTVSERLNEAKEIINNLHFNISAEKSRTIKTLVYLMDEKLEFKKPSLTPKTYQTYFEILRKYASWYYLKKQTHPNTLPADYVRELYIAKAHPNTISRYMIILKSLCNELVREKKISENPFQSVRVKKVKGTSKLPFSDSQIKELKPIIQQTDPQLWTAIELLYYLYLRPKEVRLLKINDILLEERKVCLLGRFAKDKDTIYKAIPEALLSSLAVLVKNPVHYYILGTEGKPNVNPIGVNSLNRRHSEILKKLHYNSRYTLYSWVHTGIKKAALSGIPIKQLQIQKGHADLNMFNEYLKDLGVEDCTELKNNFPVL